MRPDIQLNRRRLVSFNVHSFACRCSSHTNNTMRPMHEPLSQPPPPQQPRPSHTSSTSTHNGSFKKPKRTMRHIQCRRGYFAYVDPAVTKTTYFDGAQIGGCFQPKSHSSFWAKLTVSGWKTIPGYTGFFFWRSIQHR